MLSTLKADYINRRSFLKNEIGLLLLRYIFKSIFYHSSNLFFVNSLCSYYRGYLTSVKNFCIVSGRPRSVFSKLGISRIVLKELFSSNAFFWVKKL